MRKTEGGTLASCGARCTLLTKDSRRVIPVNDRRQGSAYDPNRLSHSLLNHNYELHLTLIITLILCPPSIGKPRKLAFFSIEC